MIMRQILKNLKFINLSFLLLALILNGCGGQITESIQKSKIPVQPKRAVEESSPLKEMTPVESSSGEKSSSEHKQEKGEDKKGKVDSESIKQEKEKKSAQKELSLNLDNADVFDVLQTIAKILNFDYIVEPSASAASRGKINIKATGKFSEDDLLPILETILEINGLTIVKAGRLYRILAISEAKQRPLEFFASTDSTDIPDEDKLIMQIMSLKYLPASTIESLLKPLMTKNGIFLPVSGTNTLLIIDLASSIKRMMELLAHLDVNTFEKIQVELIPVKNAEVETLVKELTEIFTGLGYFKGREILKFISVPRLNAFLVINAFPGLMPSIKAWIEKLDLPLTQAAVATYVYYVENAKASSIASILSKLYGEKKKGSSPAQIPAPQSPVAAPLPAGVKPQPQPEPGPVSQDIAPAGGIEGDVSIIADESTNSLIIVTSPRNYPMILDTIKKLDITPKQVLIEALIAEVFLDETNQFGLEWIFKSFKNVDIKGESHRFDTVIQTKIRPGDITNISGLPGLSFLIMETDRLVSLINAYVSEAKANVLSSPHILATNNKEAVINIGDSIPILTSQTSTAGASGGTPYVTQTIEYKDVGVILTVTPHINEKRQVTLEVKQEVSHPKKNTLGGTDSPIISKRTAKTTVVVEDNHTIVIGGLISQQIDKTREGIPLLSKLPLLGYLFGTTKDYIRKTELIVMITPRVIGSPDDARDVSEDFKRKVRSLKDKLKSIEKDRDKDTKSREKIEKETNSNTKGESK